LLVRRSRWISSEKGSSVGYWALPTRSRE
jgi:hypothetical protein